MLLCIIIFETTFLNLKEGQYTSGIMLASESYLWQTFGPASLAANTVVSFKTKVYFQVFPCSRIRSLHQPLSTAVPVKDAEGINC